MQIRTFILPVSSSLGELEDLNSFLRSVRILEIKKEFVKSDNGIYWAVCITYLPPQQPSSQLTGAMKGRIDYKNILSEAEFIRFSQLRKIRKRLADDDGVPAFAVFTDAELAEMSKVENLSVSDLKKITGIGSKKIQKYGELLCAYSLQSDDNKEVIADET